jgi:hypothetical protein
MEFPRTLDPEIWGPYFWFVLMTMAVKYPEYYSHYVPKKIVIMDELKYRQKLIYFGILVAGIYGAYTLHNK